MDTERLRFQTIIPLQKYFLILKSDDERIIEAVSAWVDRDIAKHHPAGPASRRVPVEVQLFTGVPPPDLAMPARREPTAVFEDVTFYANDDHTALTFGDTSFVNVDLKRSVAKGFVSREHVDAPWTVSHRIFYVPVLEMLRAKGACYIHAGCVCKGDRTILLCGGSGHGKSTLTYALSRGHYAYLSDDVVFVENGPAGIEIFSFPEKIKLDTRSRSFFPEFAGFAASPGKMEIPLGLTRIEDVAVSGKPHALLFCGIARGGESVMKELPASEALLRLIGQSISIASKESIERNLDMLMALVGSARSFDLQVGGTFDGVPGLVEETIFGRQLGIAERQGA